MVDRESVSELYESLTNELRNILVRLNRDSPADPHGELSSEILLYAIERAQEDRTDAQDLGDSAIRQAAIDLLTGWQTHP